VSTPSYGERVRVALGFQVLVHLTDVAEVYAVAVGGAHLVVAILPSGFGVEDIQTRRAAVVGLIPKNQVPLLPGL